MRARLAVVMAIAVLGVETAWAQRLAPVDDDVAPTTLPMPADIVHADIEYLRGSAADLEAQERELEALEAKLRRSRAIAAAAEQATAAAQPDFIGPSWLVPSRKLVELGREYGAMLLLLTPPAAFLGLTMRMHRRRKSA
jgi:hypothetical protein